MKHDRINYMAVGLFVLSMFAALLWVLFELTGKGNEATDSYHVIYNNVSGLKFGTPVYYEGYHIGQVNEITPLSAQGRTLFRVDFSIRQNWEIPADSVARVVATGLLATMSIDIKAGTSTSRLQPGTRMDGQEAADLFSVVSGVAGEINELSSQAIRPLLENLNSQFVQISQQLNDFMPGFFADLQQISSRMLSATERLDQALDEENMARIDSSLAALADGAADFRDIARALQGSQQRFDQVVANADTVVASTGRLIEDSREVVAENRPDIRATTQQLSQSATQVSARLDGILYNLEDATRNLKEFSITVRNDPSSLIGGARGSDPLIPQR